jgi:phosphoribosyl 1,2-cyclic phosphate phosphodiesterase
MGVPTLACHCSVCNSTDPRDNRMRPSILLAHMGQTAVIDTTPDFRSQALRVGLDRLDAVLFTHAHADHILGFDDIRPYNLRQRSPMPVYASAETIATLKRTFAYAFDETPAISTVPQVILHQIDGPFEVIGLEIVPIPAQHGPIGVLGFRFGSAAYLTDFSVLPDSSKPLLAGLDDLILDALRDTPHPMHQTVEQALNLVRELAPKRAWFTHIAHELPHASTNARLIAAGYPNVALAYDGLHFEARV